MVQILSFQKTPGMPAERPPSTLVSRNVTVAEHRTSVRLEPAMWDALREICAREKVSLNAIATAVGIDRSESSLTASLRVYALEYFHAAATDEGHCHAGHGATARPAAQAAPAPEPNRFTSRYRTEDKAL